MKLLGAFAAAAAALALSACSMMGGAPEGPAPGSPASRAPAAIPPPMTPAPAPATPAPVAAPVAEDLPAVSADKVKCIPPYVLQTVIVNAVEEPRCVAPSEASAKKPN